MVFKTIALNRSATLPIDSRHLPALLARIWRGFAVLFYLFPLCFKELCNMLFLFSRPVP
jgi:hypothetical protein